MSEKNEKGSVIVMAVVIMIVIAAIAFSLIILVINSTRALTVGMNATKAYYAAETGIEKSLYDINEERVAKGLLSTAVSSVSSEAAILSNDSEFHIEEITDNEDSVTFNLGQLDVGEVNYVDPNNSTTSIIGAQSTSEISWDDSGLVDMEISISQSSEGQWSDTSDNIFKFVTNSSPYGYTLNTAWIYRIRVRPLNGDVEDVTISAWEPGPLAIPIYGEIAITSMGSSGKSQSALQARTTWNAPIYSIYDFALFSQCDIIKSDDPLLTVQCP